MPFTLFCHTSSPERAYAFLDENNALLTGDTDAWQATYKFEDGGLFRKKHAIIHINYSRDYCSPPNWPQQIAGMKNYLMQFEMDPDAKAAVQHLVSQFQFTLGLVLEPEYEDNSEDMRLDVIHALAAELDATIFTEGALLDPAYRPFYTASGRVDPDAVFPVVAPSAGGLRPIPSSADEAEEEEWNPVPPDAQTVARRLYAMVGLAARGLYDMNKMEGNNPAYSLDELKEYLDAIGVDAAYDATERRIINTPGGKLAQQDTINAVWSLEGLVVLAWSLGLTKLPLYDQVVKTDKLFDTLGMGDAEFTRRVITNASLRSPTELEKYANQILLYHWRMVDFRIRPEATNFREVKIWGEPDLGWASLVDDDLVIAGSPIALADSDAVSIAESIARERHKASNWLAGYDPVYSEVDTST